MTTDNSKQCTVVNNTTSPVVTIIPTYSSTSDGEGTMVYNQNLEVLNVSSGGSVIPANGSGIVTLNQYYTDSSGQQQYSILYEFLISSAKWYNPYANLAVMQSFTVPAIYPSQTLTTDMQSAMQNTAQFVQAIAAYPTSKLATGYAAAVNSANTSGNGAADGSPDSGKNVATSMNDAVDNYLKSTKQYSNVTFANITCLQKYYNNFPFVWGNYQTTSVTYYLYSTNATAVIFVGTLTVQNPATIDLTKVNGGTTCTFAPASKPEDTSSTATDSSKAKILTYADGLFVDDVSLDIPNIALRGTFQVKSTFTQSSTDTQIIVVITGTVSGNTCVGFDQSQKSGSSDGPWWKMFFDFSTTQKAIQSILAIGGALMTLEFFGSKIASAIKWCYEKYTGKKPVTLEDLQTQMKESQEAMTKSITEAIQKLNSNSEARPPQDPQGSIDTNTQSVSDNISAGAQKSTIETQTDSVQTMGEYIEEMNSAQQMELQALASDTQKNAQTLDKAIQSDDPNVLRDQIPNTQTSLAKADANIGSLSEDLDTTLSVEAKATITNNLKSSNEVRNEVEEARKANEELPNEEDPKTEEPIEPEL